MKNQYCYGKRIVPFVLLVDWKNHKNCVGNARFVSVDDQILKRAKNDGPKKKPFWGLGFGFWVYLVKSENAQIVSVADDISKGAKNHGPKKLPHFGFWVLSLSREMLGSERNLETA